MTEERRIYLKGILGAWLLKYKFCDAVLPITLLSIAGLKLVDVWSFLLIIFVASFVYARFVWRLEKRFKTWVIRSLLEPVKS